MARRASTTVQQVEADEAAVGDESVVPDLVRAAQLRAAALREGDPQDRRAGEIDALLVERRGYVVRVGLVDEQLAARGVTA